ncbi:aldo/keto reductase [Streptomyces europaeiscabiei]|uniref:aldo/keto reductase n=1 Tax=Streptomyces europaeiscabiei TaxID=146819 RepID=UPI0029B08A82|nr:aldo/keto reductase [Streptomyces europaeiscabiei]MDX3694546.1 aldo/keto reductase [Streptomyces europaeiscabiei]
MRPRTIGRRKITNTSVELTELGFGASVIGNLYRVTPVADATAAIEAAWEAGIRYFDTARHYGLGLSELRLGAALRQRPRAEYVVSSKVGRLLVPSERPRGVDSEGFVVRDDLRRQWDFSRDGVPRSIEATLDRTGLDRLDVVHLHDPDDHWQHAADEAMPAPAELRDQGVIGAILPTAAIAFPLTHPTIINVTLGMRTAEQVGRNVELHQQHIPEALWDDLRAQGLIRSDTPGGGGRARRAQCP